MCGISGAIGAVDDEVRDAVGRAHGALVHRGPDAEGRWEDVARGHGAVFAHRRLSILDLSPLGRQPMRHEPTGHVVCFNGEIYNFRVLRRELAERGAAFRSESDTEVLLEAYARWGDDIVSHLRGMFAFALWDARERAVLLARDRLGIKPLYLVEVERSGGERAVLFASEVRALLASGLVARRIDPMGLQTFLWSGVVGTPSTIVRGVRLLEEGTLARVDERGVVRVERRYWSPPRARADGASASAPLSSAPRSSTTAQTESVHALTHVLGETLAQHIQSDVPLGVFLSGGIDSSAMAALATEVSSRRVRTFNVSFDEARYDESPHAQAVAAALGTEHTDVRLTEARFAGQLEEALAAIDQPSFDGINTYFVSRAVREAGITVALAGTGGDELFGGYPSFREVPRALGAARYAGLAPAALRRRAARVATSLATGRAGEIRPQTRWGKLEDLADARDVYGAYQVSYALFTRAFQAELLRAAPEARPDWGLPPARAAALRERVAGEPPLAAVSHLELGCFLGERLLRDSDWASMAVSLELRVPLLDHVLVEALWKVPIARRFLPLGRKQLLRDVGLRRLPGSLFERPKRGFELPMALWTRRALAGELERTLTDVSLAYRAGLNGEAIARAWRAYRDGAPGIYWSRIWALYVLLRYARAHALELG
jgi:asparagine synthase (glutamine-hydrolysing)